MYVEIIEREEEEAVQITISLTKWGAIDEDELQQVLDYLSCARVCTLADHEVRALMDKALHKVGH